ncbi:MAG: molybdopterin molybdenumtransferase MoeA, partial [Flammeovirgaceae bacterium]
DRDLPPFDRVTMDGIAVSFAALSTQSTFSIQSIQAAGDPAQTLLSPSHCIEIMTGAMLPEGADTIVPYEQLEIQQGIATINPSINAKKGQNIHRQGSDANQGEVILQVGTKLSPAEIAVLASVGKHQVLVVAWPKIAIVSTGNELVDVAATPQLHQIRKSNSYALLAALQIIGCTGAVFHCPMIKLL